MSCPTCGAVRSNKNEVDGEIVHTCNVCDCEYVMTSERLITIKEGTKQLLTEG